MKLRLLITIFFEELSSKLGFDPHISYERYRTTWLAERQNSQVKIDVDELPFGNYVELEGENAEDLYSVAHDLDLNPDSHITLAYGKLYRELERQNGRVPKDHIRFENEQQ